MTKYHAFLCVAVLGALPASAWAQQEVKSVKSRNLQIDVAIVESTRTLGAGPTREEFDRLVKAAEPTTLTIEIGNEPKSDRKR